MVDDIGLQGVERWLNRHLDRDGPGFEIEEILPQRPVGNHTVDAVILLEAPSPPGGNALLVVETRSRGAPSSISPALVELQEIDLPHLAEGHGVDPDWTRPLLAAPYLSGAGRRLCRQYEVDYLDLAGNCHFRLGTYFVERTGKENPRREKQVLRSLFAPKASRVSRTLLETPARAWTLSGLADATEISLGHAHKTVEALADHDFVSRNEEHRVVLDQPGALLDHWAANYDVTEQESQSYYTFDRSRDAFLETLAAAADRVQAEYALTLHAGASLVAPYTRSDETHLYVRPGDVDRWIEELDLRPVESGANVRLLPAWDAGVFHRRQRVDGAAVVSNTQLYIDLYNHPARGREQARHLRDERIPY